MDHPIPIRHVSTACTFKQKHKHKNSTPTSLADALAIHIQQVVLIVGSFRLRAAAGERDRKGSLTGTEADLSLKKRRVAAGIRRAGGS